MSNFVFANIKALDLVLGKCPNNHLHIFGFGHQLRGTLDEEAMTYTTTAECRECGCEVKRVDKVMLAEGVVDQGLGI